MEDRDKRELNELNEHYSHPCQGTVYLESPAGLPEDFTHGKEHQMLVTQRLWAAVEAKRELQLHVQLSRHLLSLLLLTLFPSFLLMEDELRKQGPERINGWIKSLFLLH